MTKSEHVFPFSHSDRSKASIFNCVSFLNAARFLVSSAACSYTWLLFSLLGTNYGEEKIYFKTSDSCPLMSSMRTVPGCNNRIQHKLPGDYYYCLIICISSRLTSFAALIFSLLIDFRSLYGLRLVSETSVAFYSPWFSPCVAIATSFLTFKDIRAKVIHSSKLSGCFVVSHCSMYKPK